MKKIMICALCTLCGWTSAAANDTLTVRIEGMHCDHCAHKVKTLLKKDAGINATIKDITSNPHNISFKELEAAQISRINKEVAFVVLNGNYALDAGYNAATDALAYEDSSSTAASVYANIIAVKKGNEKKAKIKALVKALKSDSLKNWLKTRFKGSVIAYNGK